MNLEFVLGFAIATLLFAPENQNPYEEDKPVHFPKKSQNC